jgi:peptidyl-prolyl cis-trans isomerase D
MLGFMRKHARSGVIKIIFLMIIIVFVFWGVGVMVGGGSRVNVAAMVDGDSITAQEYTRAYANMQRTYQQLYRENFTPEIAAQLNLHQRALDGLITDLLLRREAARLGLQVSDEEVREAIVDLPTFSDGGRFDRARYLAALRASQMTPAEFEEAQRETLLVAKLDSLLTDGIYVTDKELHDLFVLENEKIDVAFVKVPYARYRDKVAVTDAEMAEYYEKNPEFFREPERVTLTYVSYQPQGFLTSVPTSDESVAEYYDTHKSYYDTREKIRVRRILFVVPADADDAERAAVREKAEAVLAEAKAGGDFAALARRHSGDPLSSDAGGDLGLVERDTLEDPLEEAAFSLESGQVSDLIETPQGLNVIKVEEKQPVATRPLAEVREEIVRTLQEIGAENAARDALAADLTRAREGTPIEEIAKDRGLTTATSEPVARGQRLPDVEGPALLTTAFGLEVDAVDELLGRDPPYYLFKVVAKTPSAITPLEEARAKIVETLRSGKAKEAAQAEAAAILEAARANGGLAGLINAARAKGYTVEETGPFGRTETIPKLGPAPVHDQLFALTDPAPLGTRPLVLADAAVAAALKERVAPDEATFAEKRGGLRDSTVARKRQQVIDTYRDLLRKRAHISINPDVVTDTAT